MLREAMALPKKYRKGLLIRGEGRREQGEGSSEAQGDRPIKRKGPALLSINDWESPLHLEGKGTGKTYRKRKA